MYRRQYSEITTGWKIRDLDFCRSKKFVSSLELPDCFWGPSSLLCNGYRGSFLGVKWPGRDVHSSPSGAEVMNESIYTSVFPLCLHERIRDNFTLRYIFSHLIGGDIK
jgi:hypothetical protein